jgi:NitT/TauT family transport system substrate-binding protein
MRSWVVATIAFMMVVAAVGCAAPSATPAPSAPPPAAAGRLEGSTHGMPPAAVDAPAPPERVSLRFPITAIAGSTLLLPLGREAGLFERYGLDIDIITMAGSSLAVQAMLAGDLPLSAVSSAAVIEADLAGAQIDIIAGVVNRANNMVMAVPEINSVADFRGRRVGVPRLGDSNDFLIRYALRQAGVEPDRDVSILQIGLNSEMLTAMQNGAIEGGALSSPTTIRARRLGYKQVADLGEMGIPYQHTTVNVLRSYLQAHPDVVRRFLKAYVETIHLFKADKAFTKKVLSDFARTDDEEVLEETWELYALRYLERVPYPTLDGLQSVLNESPQPSARTARPEQFVDLRLLDELKAAGFFDELRARYGD